MTFLFSLAEEVLGILCIGKFSREQITELESLGRLLVFVDSDTLLQGHPCVTTDFENAVQTALSYLMNKGCKSMGLLTGQEKQRIQLKSFRSLVTFLS